ncbi:MAG: hypothetical protein HYS05_12135 [Acidobacteria bacterium]|nr:hypothetical protein [Acidobacteriota bacterium]
MMSPYSSGKTSSDRANSSLVSMSGVASRSFSHRPRREAAARRSSNESDWTIARQWIGVSPARSPSAAWGPYITSDSSRGPKMVCRSSSSDSTAAGAEGMEAFYRDRDSGFGTRDSWVGP